MFLCGSGAKKKKKNLMTALKGTYYVEFKFSTFLCFQLDLNYFWK